MYFKKICIGFLFCTSFVTLPVDAMPLSVLEPNVVGPAAQNVVDLNAPPAKEEATEEKEKWGDVLDIATALEFELHRFRDFNKRWFTSFQDATVEIHFTFDINDWATALISLESDFDNSDRMSLKEGYFTLGGTEEYPYFLKSGRQFVPFGLGDGAILGDTLTITDPLTIEIFETRETAAMVGKVWDDYRIGAYVFNRATPIQHNHHTQFGLTIDKGKETDDFTYDFGIDFLSMIFDTNGLTDAFPGALNVEFAPGVAVHARYFKNHFSFIAEAEIALEKTTFTQAGEELNLAPKAWMIELGYVTEIYSIKSFAAVDYSQSYEVHGAFAKDRILGVIGAWLFENTLFSFEVGHENDYGVAQGGTGNSGATYVLQVAVEF
jgi:hypothetical protein